MPGGSFDDRATVNNCRVVIRGELSVLVVIMAVYVMAGLVSDDPRQGRALAGRDGFCIVVTVFGQS